LSPNRFDKLPLLGDTYFYGQNRNATNGSGTQALFLYSAAVVRRAKIPTRRRIVAGRHRGFYWKESGFFLP
jgi:hypothetical protein